MQQYTKKLLLWGTVSGIITFLILAIFDSRQAQSSFDTFFNDFLPGIIFGVILGAYFYKMSMCSLSKGLVFAIISTGAYYGAVYLALSNLLSDHVHYNIPSVANFLIAGAFGSAVLSVAIQLLISKIKAVHAVIIIIVGTITGSAFFGLSISTPHFEIAFLIWQAAVATAIGFAIDQSRTQNIIQSS